MAILTKLKPMATSKVIITVTRELLLEFELACLKLGMSEAEIAIKLGTAVDSTFKQIVNEVTLEAAKL